MTAADGVSRHCQKLQMQISDKTNIFILFLAKLLAHCT